VKTWGATVYRSGFLSILDDSDAYDLPGFLSILDDSDEEPRSRDESIYKDASRLEAVLT